MSLEHVNSFAETGSLRSSSPENLGPTARTDETGNHRDDSKEETEASDLNAFRKPIFAAWTKLTEMIHLVIKSTVVKCAVHAAGHPKTYVGVTTFLSLLLVTVGYFTNFHLELDFEKVFAPMNSMPANNQAWVLSDDGFPDDVRKIGLVMHNNGDSIMNIQAMERVFLGLSTIRETPGYDDLCQQGAYIDFEGARTCRVISPTGFFHDHMLESFKEKVVTDEDLRQSLSSYEFANGSPVYRDAILGKLETEGDHNITSAQSFLATVEIPDKEDSNRFERNMLGRLQSVRKQWQKDDDETGKSILKMDVMSIYAYEVEYQRAIEGDLWLVPLVAIVMCSFVALTFVKYGHAHGNFKSRTLLGVASVYTIGMSFLTGNGIMFICGVPFTTVTQILPFIVFGIGLDDTFIITGAYFRTDPKLDPVERIRVTMEEVAHSISLTTVTTVFAFLLGLLSSLPGVQWLCIYACTTIFVDFIYQITLFCAFIILDEQRIQANRRDCIFCLEVKENVLNNVGQGSDSEAEIGPECVRDNKAPQSVPEKVMHAYAKFLLRPWVKATVLLLFAALSGCCIYSSTMLTQEFKLGDYVPDDSYLKETLYSLERYSSVLRPIGVYFRNMDQTDPDIQKQMIHYVNSLEELEQFSSSDQHTDSTAAVEYQSDGLDDLAQDLQGVTPCWVRDFYQMKDEIFALRPGFEFIENMTFIDQLTLALADPLIREVYGRDIIRDDTGNITASRCWLFLSSTVDLNDVQSQIDTLHDQRSVGATTNRNVGNGNNGNGKHWSMFLYDNVLFYWEAYDVAVRELIFTIISGVIALTVIAFVMIPHWTAVCFVTPMIVLVYGNFLGTLQFFGLHINGIFYICVVVSVGLLVDFLLHILLRYYETPSSRRTRNDRVQETLETMGASILLGGLTTLLAVVPLCLSSTKIFMTVFLAFFAMVVLGILHGLVLLPVVLSLVGPTVSFSSSLCSVQEKPPSLTNTWKDSIDDSTSDQDNGKERGSTPNDTVIVDDIWV